MTIAVLNATGAQGGAIADRLERDQPVRRLSRSEGPGLSSVNTDSEDALAQAFDGASAVVFTPPLDYRPGAREAYARRVVTAAERAGVGRLVLNTAAPVPDEGDESTVVLREIRETIRSGGVPSTVIQPTIYLDNLIAPWSLPAIVNEGVFAYPLREDATVSWISHRALADFIAAVLDDGGSAGRTYDIGGPRPLTGPELATIVGRVAGREVRFVAADPIGFAEGLGQVYGPDAAREIGGIYARAAADPSSLRRGTEPWKSLGVAPEEAEAWAARQAWRI